MNVDILNDRVLVKPTESDAELMSQGGIIIPKSVQYSSRKGLVVAAGPGRRNNDGTYSPMQVKTGDTVFYVLGAGIDVAFGRDRYVLIPEMELLAIEQAKVAVEHAEIPAEATVQ